MAEDHGFTAVADVQIQDENGSMTLPVEGGTRLERIFADKIFTAEFYYERARYFDVAKHIYDVGVMLDLQPIRDEKEQKFDLPSIQIS